MYTHTNAHTRTHTHTHTRAHRQQEEVLTQYLNAADLVIKHKGAAFHGASLMIRSSGRNSALPSSRGHTDGGDVQGWDEGRRGPLARVCASLKRLQGVLGLGSSQCTAAPLLALCVVGATLVSSMRRLDKDVVDTRPRAFPSKRGLDRARFRDMLEPKS